MNKLLLITITILLSLTIANAKTTICYKKDWTSPSTIETTPLDGGECESKYSLIQMKENVRYSRFMYKIVQFLKFCSVCYECLLI